MRFRNRVEAILKMALPITAGLSSTFIMVFIDLAMVGQLGSEAIAAIGLAGFSYALILCFIQGLAPAVQGLIAKKKGLGETQDLCLPLNGGVLIAVAIGIPMSIFCYLINPWYFQQVASDPLVVEHSIAYLTILSFSMVGVGISEAFEGHWNGIGKTKVFMFNLFIINSLNVLFNYIFIFGNWGAPALGTMGAGLATLLSVYIGNLSYVLITAYLHRGQGFLCRWPSTSLIKHIINIAIPESFREFTLALGYVIFFWLVGKIGTNELAATNVIVRIYSVLNLFPMALGSVSATLVSGAIGKGDYEEATLWGWATAKVGIFVITALALPLVFAPELVLSLFITDSTLVAEAALPLQVVGITSGITSLIFIFAYTLITIGDVNRVLAVSFGTQWLFFLPLVWFAGVFLDFGLLEIWVIHTLYALLATLMVTLLWSNGRWKSIKQVAV
ncbi:MATE family efflux transporter [Pseudoalteromonas sp. J010]|uniref:MATE family efflux transporter n=1 Tax=Pseudoalteromonas sp. J010 TaxID=998465 RepID=UPI000F653D64|nr:MATE family efflux transporter [Pseudoalteromonas sp. J010]RRS06508.1 MATE family efflux transporter [Pseudoalteromonas sp. J010]